MIVSIVGILAALLLAWRSFSGRTFEPRRIWAMAAVWLVIILGLVLVIQSLGLSGAD